MLVDVVGDLRLKGFHQHPAGSFAGEFVDRKTNIFGTNGRNCGNKIQHSGVSSLPRQGQRLVLLTKRLRRYASILKSPTFPNFSYSAACSDSLCVGKVLAFWLLSHTKISLRFRPLGLKILYKIINVQVCL